MNQMFLLGALIFLQGALPSFMLLACDEAAMKLLERYRATWFLTSLLVFIWWFVAVLAFKLLLAGIVAAPLYELFDRHMVRFMNNES